MRFKILVNECSGILDSSNNLVSTREHLIIPESKYAIATRGEIGCADFVFGKSIRMLAAIEFDYQSAFD